MTFQSIGDVAGKLVDRWAWYFAALKDPESIGKTLLASESDPQQGYFRARFKDGQWEPVALFYPDGSDQLVGYRNGREVEDINALWLSCLRHPISYEAYEKAMAGDGFDDEPPLPRDHNLSSDDPYDALWQEFLGEKEMAEEFLKKGIHTQEDADKVAIWKDRIMKIKSRAQGFFKAEKQPVLDEGRRIDERWRPLAHDRDSDTSAMIEKIRLGMEGFFQKKKAAEQERQRKAREEAEAAHRAALEAARKAQESDQQSAIEREKARQEADRLAAEARAKEQEAAARKVSAGRTGARTSIRVEKKGEITDFDALLTALKDRAEIRDLVQSLANRAAKAGVALPGMKIVEVEKVI